MHDTRIHILKLAGKLAGYSMTIARLIEDREYSQARDIAIEAKRIAEEIIEKLTTLERHTPHGENHVRRSRIRGVLHRA